MKLTWLGQAGWLFCTDAGTRIMIDPYLSDSLRERKGEDYRRQVEIRQIFLQMELDGLVITHDHADHLDWATLRQIFSAQKTPITVLGPGSVWNKLRGENPWHNELVLFGEGSQYTIGDALLHGVFAAHSDPEAIGVVIEAEGKRVYHSGDTLCHDRLIHPKTSRADLMMLSINGKGNNMNIQDGVRLTKALNPKTVVPMHWDMFGPMGCDPEPFARLLDGAKVQVRLLRAYDELFI